MKKIFTLASFISLSLSYAQDIPFNKLYGNSDPANYYLGHYPVPGSDGLEIKWDGGMKFSTGAANPAIQIGYSGNVGIGTATPSQLLNVHGKSGSPARSGTQQNGIAAFSSIDTYSTLYTGNYIASPYAMWLQSDSRNNLGNYPPLSINPNGGNVGIGTSSPQGKFEVDFNNEKKTMRFFQPSSNNPENSLISSLMFTWYDQHTDMGMIRGASANIIGLGFRFNGNEKMRLTADGNLGIGTSNPIEKLDVNGSVRINNGAAHTTIRLGNESNDAIIVDNSTAKSFGGGYFFRVHNPTSQYIDAMILAENGNVGIGLTKPQNKLDVNGTIHAKEVKVDLSGWADYVFKKEYALPTLEQVEKHIQEKGHLPGIPSEKEVLEKGISLGENQKLLLQKLEELTLYSIEQNKQLKIQNKQLKIQSERIEILEKKISTQKN